VASEFRAAEQPQRGRSSPKSWAAQSAHLYHIAPRKRVPSRETAELLIDTLNLKGDIADELRATATPMWWETDRRSW
jgi:hypothetical protein